jgi:hypothetical protein
MMCKEIYIKKLDQHGLAPVAFQLKRNNSGTRPAEHMAQTQVRGLVCSRALATSQLVDAQFPYQLGDLYF